MKAHSLLMKNDGRKEMMNKIQDGSSEKSYQNANCLIRCMKNKEYLLNDIKRMGMSPRYNLESYQYLNIEYQNMVIKEMAIPMLCFCDIPLKQLSRHYGVYGAYGIALTKEWGEKNRISPIHYLYKNTDIFEEIKNLFEYANEHQIPQIYNYLFNRLMFTKPKYGYQNEKIKLFTDEQEHRYIPNLFENTEVDQFYINPDFNIYDLSTSISNDEKYLLHFSSEDVKYIIVELEGDKIDVVNKIMENNTLTKGEKFSMVTKIISIEEIEDDF